MQFSYHLKSYGELGGFYPPRPMTSGDNTLLDLCASSDDTQPHSIMINNYCQPFFSKLSFLSLFQWTERWTLTSLQITTVHHQKRIKK